MTAARTITRKKKDDDEGGKSIAKRKDAGSLNVNEHN